MRIPLRCPVCHAVMKPYPAVVGFEGERQDDGRYVSRRLYALAVRCSMHGEHWDELVGQSAYPAPAMRRLMSRVRQAIRTSFVEPRFELPDDASIRVPNWYNEAITEEVAEEDVGRFTEADWERLRTYVEKDVLPFHLEDREPEFIPAGAIVILRSGEMGVAMNGFRKRDAEAATFTEIIGSELQSPKDVELHEPDEVTATVMAVTHPGLHGEIYLGGMGTQVEKDLPILVRVLRPRRGWGKKVRVGLEDLAWVLETDNDQHMAAFLAVVDLYTKGDSAAMKLVQTLAQAPAWAIAKEVDAIMKHLISAHVEDGELVLVYADGTVERRPLDGEPESAPAPEPVTTAPVQEQLPLEPPAPEPAKPAPQTTPQRPTGPHVAVVVGNRVVRWAPFKPVRRPNGRGFSVNPRDENVRKLAEFCRELRAKGEPAELRYVVMEA